MMHPHMREGPHRLLQQPFTHSSGLESDCVSDTSAGPFTKINVLWSHLRAGGWGLGPQLSPTCPQSFLAAACEGLS